MTTLDTSETTAPGTARPVYRVTPARVFRSELTKLCSLRSTWFLLAGVGAALVGLAALFAAAYASDVDAGRAEPSTAAAIDTSFDALHLGSLLIVVLGMMQMTGEYASGSIRPSLTAVPRRLPLLWAKALAITAVIAPVMLLVCSASFLTGQAVAGEHGAGLGDGGALRAVITGPLTVVALALVGLGLATVIRHTAAALTTYVGVMLVAPALLALAVPEPVRDAVLPFHPGLAAEAVYTLDTASSQTDLLAPGTAGAVLAVYIVLALAAGAVVLRVRDV
ncbi:ABC transporter permease subunit [Spirillospora sp. NPDC029432]|uniref:ABC transporter permease subunit n=1 Tax=Spirillospora sp. NPDC029432 TaxID=3154599 RepID=UPI003454CC2F